MVSSAPPPDAVEVCNPAGTLRVWVSATGLPLHIEIAPTELARGSQAVAAAVLDLCRQVAS